MDRRHFRGSGRGHGTPGVSPAPPGCGGREGGSGCSRCGAVDLGSSELGRAAAGLSAAQVVRVLDFCQAAHHLSLALAASWLARSRGGGTGAVGKVGGWLERVGNLSRPARPVRRNQLTPVWLIRAWDLIQSRFTEPLTIEDIAREVGIHPLHLACLFRQTCRCTIGESIRQLRVEFAAEQISGTDLPLAVIAQQAGFCSLRHLSVYFKKHMGLNPSEFRRSLRSG